MDLKVQRIYTSAGENRSETSAAGPEPFDVVVHLTNGNEYIASFLTYGSILAIQRQHQATGDYLNGAFFWTKKLVLVADDSPEMVRRVVDFMIDEGEFAAAFEKV